MLLKQRIMQEIETLPKRDLLVIQRVIHALSTTKTIPQTPRGKAYLLVREALQNTQSSWAQDIVQQREDRL